ncbi:glycosyltransferase family 2 protein [Rubrimonas cliftonensis]|uniref:Glycosyl transferase family 2 n=1 Tax=Rubrimonas cliftonensis TaxID=89524 RepID=A0A1H3VWL7_9RHOB|nr:glycosyltransferase [Rubrimonas cliftonensis]SDZ78492.1 Glycosyl transferase family 2 [Rubrimonas cliftonensis]
MRLLVSIPTRNRPQLLKAALDSLARADAPEGATIEILVVDNNADPDEAARIAALVADSAGRFPARVETEGRLGIPFVRNRALAAARRGGHDAVFLLDADQTVAPDIFRTLLKVAAEEAADVVKPLVRWEFEPPARYGEAFEGRKEPADPPPRTALTGHVATNGVLVSRRVWGDIGLSFDERRPLIGGEDAGYFTRAAAAGAVMTLTRETHEVEFRPAAKQTRAWLLRRAMRVGNAEALFRLKGYSSAQTFLSGLLQAAYYGVAAVAPASRPERRIRRLSRCAKALGAMLGALGVCVKEYRRTVGR